jgi:hypothetical protein
MSVAPPSLPSPDPGPTRRTLGAVRIRGWIARHPFWFVAMLSPGIVEYLSGSSQLAGLVLAPPLFFLFLAANLGLYVPGVLLIREAKARWNGGWATVVLLGTAYAIVEEGLALSTLFNPAASVVGALGFYGHFVGVSWVWLVGVVAIHVVLSISIPVYLLELSFPQLRGRPWLTRRQVTYAVVALAADTAALMAITTFFVHFFLGIPLIVGSLTAVTLLVYAAYRVPAGTLRAWSDRPKSGPVVFAVVGASFWPGMVLAQALCGRAGIPAAAAVALSSLVLVGYGAFVLARIGARDHAPHLIALAVGVIAPIAVIGAIVQFHAPVVLLADGAAAWFFWHMWNRYRATPDRSPTRPAPTLA